MAHGKIIFGNWKMHKTTSEIKAYFQSLNHLLTNDKVLVKLPTRIGIAPSYLGIAEANKYLQLNVSLLAQNVAVADAGAYTGQVSYRMLQDFHINHVLVGHSEVRQMLNETDTLLNAKVKLLLSNKFTVVLCVGESLNDFETQQTMQVITKQLTTGLKDCHEHLEQLIIAYEPIWAIGTGKTATNDIVQSTCQAIKKILVQILGQAGQQVKILYGGSVNENNAKAILALPSIDGVLVGGASLDPAKFYQIITATPEYSQA